MYPYGGQQMYPYGGQMYPYGGQMYPYGGQMYPYGGQMYPYGGQQMYPYGGQMYPYGGQMYPYQQYPYQQYPYQQYPYQQAQYQSADWELDSGDNQASGNVEPGDTISIILSSNASTGYRWELDDDELDTDIISKKSSQYYAGYGYGVGVAGTEQWIFEAEEEGTTTIKLDYKRAGETSAQSTFWVQVTVTD